VTQARISTGEEIGNTRAFAWAIDWPGWCRTARDRLLLPEALSAAAPRYAIVAVEAGLDFVADPADLTADDFELLETVEGSAATDFGVPYTIAELDRRPLAAADAERLARLVQAAWVVFDRVVAGAPAELRKGPRGGGRDRTKIVAHCVASDSAYAGQMGIRLKEPAPTDRPAIKAEREAILEVLRQPSDGSPLDGRKWPTRYAARRIAWHALDHAWEIEDKSEPMA
jgi:hypothetical protein